MKRQILRIRLALLVLLLTMLLAATAGCAQGPQPVLVEGDEQAKIFARVDPIADELFAAMNARDYDLFSQRFDPQMKQAMDEAAFLAMVDSIQGRVGGYLSRELRKVEQVGDFISVTYDTRYEDEETVSWRVVVTPGEAPLVSGLWYDSPKLRAR